MRVCELQSSSEHVTGACLYIHGVRAVASSLLLVYRAPCNSLIMYTYTRENATERERERAVIIYIKCSMRLLLLLSSSMMTRPYTRVTKNIYCRGIMCIHIF